MRSPSVCCSWGDAERALRMCGSACEDEGGGVFSLTAGVGLATLYARYGWPAETLQAAAKVLEHLEAKQPFSKHRRMPEVVQVTLPTRHRDRTH